MNHNQVPGGFVCSLRLLGAETLRCDVCAAPINRNDLYVAESYPDDSKNTYCLKCFRKRESATRDDDRH